MAAGPKPGHRITYIYIFSPSLPRFSSDMAGGGPSPAASLADGALETAWSDPDWAARPDGTWVTYAVPMAGEGGGRAGSLSGLVAYSVTSAADQYAADPRDWVVEARRGGGGSWEEVDARRNVAFSRRGQRKIFPLGGAAAAAATWDEIRLRMTATQGGFRDGSFRNIFWGG